MNKKFELFTTGHFAGFAVGWSEPGARYKYIDLIIFCIVIRINF